MRHRLTVNLPPITAATLAEFAANERRPRSAAAVHLIQAALKTGRTTSASARETDLKNAAHFAALHEQIEALREQIEAQLTVHDATSERRILNLVKLLQR